MWTVLLVKVSLFFISHKNLYLRHVGLVVSMCVCERVIRVIISMTIHKNPLKPKIPLKLYIKCDDDWVSPVSIGLLLSLSGK